MAKIEKRDLPKEVLIEIGGVKVNPNVNVADRLKKSLISDGLKPKEQATTTPPTNQTISIEKLQHLIDNGDVGSVTLPTDDMAKLVNFVANFVKADRVQFLIDLHQKTIDKCYECFYSETTPEIQKVYQLIDIARVDMMIQAIIRVYGNQVLPDSLWNWKPVFGLHWQMRATALIVSKQNDWENNPFWYEAYMEMISGAIEEGVTVVKNIQGNRLNLPLTVRSVEEVTIEHVADYVSIHIGEQGYVIRWEELDDFYDKRQNKPNHLATILQDLQSDLDGCLRADGGVLYSRFAKGNRKPNTQISKLSSALDSIIFIENDRDSQPSKRWFQKSDKYSHTRWYPRFISPINQSGRMANMILDKEEKIKKTPMELVKDSVELAEPQSLLDQGVYPISEKKWKLQEQYQDDIDDVIVQSSRLDAKVPD